MARGPLIALFAGFGAVCCLRLVSLAGLAVAAQSALRAGSSNTPTPAATHTRARPTEPSPTPRPTEVLAPTLTPPPTLTPTPAFAFVAFLYANAGTGPWQFEDARSIAVDGVALGMTFTPVNELLIAARDRVMKLIVQAPPPTPTP
ncbi:MAG: hypothetical protein ACRDH2_02795 [Anaerolineales bacterium]